MKILSWSDHTTLFGESNLCDGFALVNTETPSKIYILLGFTIILIWILG